MQMPLHQQEGTRPESSFRGPALTQAAQRYVDSQRTRAQLNATSSTLVAGTVTASVTPNSQAREAQQNNDQFTSQQTFGGCQAVNSQDLIRQAIERLLLIKKQLIEERKQMRTEIATLEQKVITLQRRNYYNK